MLPSTAAPTSMLIADSRNLVSRWRKAAWLLDVVAGRPGSIGTSLMFKQSAAGHRLLTKSTARAVRSSLKQSPAMVRGLGCPTTIKGVPTIVRDEQPQLTGGSRRDKLGDADADEPHTDPLKP
jgi:hypothetical protein